MREGRRKTRIERATCESAVTNMLTTLAIILLVMWALGLGFHIAGGLIHIILVVALILFVMQMLTGRRA